MYVFKLGGKQQELGPLLNGSEICAQQTALSQKQILNVARN